MNANIDTTERVAQAGDPPGGGTIADDGSGGGGSTAGDPNSGNSGDGGTDGTGPDTADGSDGASADGGSADGGTNGTDTGGNTTGGGDAANGTGQGPAGGSGDAGGGVFSRPDPGEMVLDAMSTLLESFASGVEAVIDVFNQSLLTLPAAGQPGDPMSWLIESVNDPMWTGVAIVYLMCSGLALPIIWGVGMFNAAVPTQRSTQEKLWTLAKALTLISIGWFLLMAWIHSWNVAILTFAPSGDEFLATPGDATRLGLGVAMGVIILSLKAVIVLIGVGVHVAFIMLTYILVVTWPLGVALHYSNLMGVAPLGTSAMVAALIVSPLYFVKAIILRLLFELPIGFGFDELFNVLLIMVGVVIAFVFVPLQGLKNLMPQTVVGAAGRQARQTKKAAKRVRTRTPSAGQLRDRVSRAGGDSSGQSQLRQSNNRDYSSRQSTRARARYGRAPSKSHTNTRHNSGPSSDTRTRSRGGD